MIVQPLKSRSLVRSAVALWTLVALIAAVACSDPFAAKASLAVQSDTLVAFSLSGTPPEFPAGLNTAFRSIVRVDAGHNYDLAFDLDAQGKIRLIPVKLVGGLVTTARRVGIQKASGTFESVTIAPTSGYTYDSVTVVQPGDAAIIEATNSDQCSFSISSLLYSKISLDSVNTSTRQIFLRITHDPNCGFRSFQPGVPKN